MSAETVQVRAEQRFENWTYGEVRTVPRTHLVEALIANGRLTVIDTPAVATVAVVEKATEASGKATEATANAVAELAPAAQEFVADGLAEFAPPEPAPSARTRRKE